jgi:hypothetical protein
VLLLTALLTGSETSGDIIRFAMMEPETKEYIRSLLTLLKEMFGKVHALEMLIHFSTDRELDANLESKVAQALSLPLARRALDEKFDARIEEILRQLDDQEALSALLRSPTKGLPN